MKVIQLVSNDVWGGGERYVADLSARLVAEGVEVLLVTNGCEAIDSRMRALGLHVAHAPLRGYADVRSPFAIARAIRSMSGDDRVVVHAHNFKTAYQAALARKLVGKRREVKIVMTRHLIKKGKKGIISNFIYRNLDALVCISEIVRREFLGSSPRIAEERVHLVPNSICRVPEPPREVPAEPPVRLLFIGRLSPEKGVEMLFEALSRLDCVGWRLTIAGTGEPEYEKKLHENAERLGIDDRIDWVGYVEEIWPLVRSSHIGVFPSRWREPFGLSILEFISQGVPVVSTDHGAQKEILTDGVDSLLVPPEPGAFSEALKKIITDRELRGRMGHEALRTFGRFDYETFFGRILEIYSC